MVLVAILFFCVGAIIAAVGNNFTYMLVGRTIQGVGGGGIIALSEIIVTDLIPLRYRGQYFGILSAMWSLGSVAGPILGGGFAENVTWVSLNQDFRGTELISIAMDLLYQLPLHRLWCHFRGSLLEAQHPPELIGREASSH
jgi:MFS family permease